MAQSTRRPKNPNRSPATARRETPGVKPEATVAPPTPSAAKPQTVTVGAAKPTAAERRAARAEQARLERQQKQRRNLMIGAVGAVVLALAVFAFLRYQAANQVGRAVPLEQSPHVNSGTAITYRHVPPSSGTHFGDQVTSAGIYRQEQPEGAFVHALEHGYVVVAVKCADGCPDTIRQLEELYNSGDIKPSQFGNKKLIVTPYSKPFTNPADEAPITLLAWGYEEMLQSVDRAKIIKFYDRYVDKGPERVP